MRGAPVSSMLLDLWKTKTKSKNDLIFQYVSPYM